MRQAPLVVASNLDGKGFALPKNTHTAAWTAGVSFAGADLHKMLASNSVHKDV